LLAIVVYLIIRTFALKFVTGLLAIIFCKKKSNQINPSASFGTFTDEYKGMALRSLASYDIRKNEFYSGLI
jgi:hypothetical protein